MGLTQYLEWVSKSLFKYTKVEICMLLQASVVRSLVLRISTFWQIWELQALWYCGFIFLIWILQLGSVRWEGTVSNHLQKEHFKMDSVTKAKSLKLLQRTFVNWDSRLYSTVLYCKKQFPSTSFTVRFSPASEDSEIFLANQSSEKHDVPQSYARTSSWIFFLS